MLSASMRVERNIDGIWFPAVILKIDSQRGVVSLKYIDDDNIEHMVPSEDVRIPFRDTPLSPKVDKKKTLPKPLAGLMDDDYEERNNHVPKVVVHTTDDDADTGDVNERCITPIVYN